MATRKNHILKLAHYSLLFAVGEKAAKHDAEMVFSRGYDWVTGTESGEDPLMSALRSAAHQYGYKIYFFKSNWIGVKKEIFEAQSWKTLGHTVVDNDLVAGPGHDSNIAQVTFKHKILGRITVLCGHYPTKGRPGGDREHSQNLRWTQKMAKKIGDLAKRYGKGKSKVFYGGDQNILDSITDTFFGEPLTSGWDELHKYDNTGHGNIDVIASYDRDKAVSCKWIRSLTDKELQMASDHFPVEAAYNVLYKAP
jgi:exonuclease III